MSFKKVPLIISSTLCVTLFFAGMAAVFAQTEPAASSSEQAEPIATSSEPVATSSEVQVQQESAATSQNPGEQSMLLLSSEKQTRVINLTANMSNKTEAVIARFENILGRIETRAGKMEKLGYDMADTHFFIQETRTALDEAKAGMANIDNVSVSFATSEDQLKTWQLVRDTFTNTKALLIRIEQMLKNAVDELYLTRSEGIPIGENELSTTTPAES